MEFPLEALRCRFDCEKMRCNSPARFIPVQVTSDFLSAPRMSGIPQVLTFSVDGGYLLAAGGTHSAKGVASVYDVKTGERVIQVGDELDTVFGADVNDDLSKIALGGPQRLVRVFDTASGESLFDLNQFGSELVLF